MEAELMNIDLADAAVLWSLRGLYACLILAVGIWLAFFLSGHVRRQAIRHPRIDTTLGTFIGLVIRYLIIGFVLIAVLQNFGVQTTSLAAVIGAAALAIGLAVQGTLGNVASGIVVALFRPYRIGDFVELNGHEGLVVDLDLFFTELETLDDRHVFVPNGAAISNPVVNYTRQGRRRCIIVIGVGYDDDIDHVMAVMRKMVGADPRTLSEPPPWFGVESLGEYSVNVEARAWIRIGDYLQYRSDMLHRLKEAFDREGIDIPYPHAVELSKGELTLRLPPIKPEPHRDAEKGETGPA